MRMEKIALMLAIVALACSMASLILGFFGSQNIFSLPLQTSQQQTDATLRADSFELKLKDYAAAASSPELMYFQRIDNQTLIAQFQSEISKENCTKVSESTFYNDFTVAMHASPEYVGRFTLERIGNTFYLILPTINPYTLFSNLPPIIESYTP